jgi:hypothetical protein
MASRQPWMAVLATSPLPSLMSCAPWRGLFPLPRAMVAQNWLIRAPMRGSRWSRRACWSRWSRVSSRRSARCLRRLVVALGKGEEEQFVAAQAEASRSG